MSINKSFYKAKGVTFVPTYECASKCIHCNVDYNSFKKFEKMDADFAVDVLRQVKKLEINAFQFSGGEPTLHPDLMVAVIREGKRLSMHCHRPPRMDI